MKSFFNLALLLSAGIHIIIIGFSPYNPFDFTKTFNKDPKTEFTKIEQKELKEEINLADKVHLQEPPPYLDIKNQLVTLKKTEKPILQKPQITRPERSKKSVVFTKPPQKLDSIPAYINYYEKIRNKIKNAAYSNYIPTESGKIFLNFTVDTKGGLLDISFQEGKPIKSNYLAELALQSIKKSSPFPEFPQELKEFGTLTFSLSIHFKSN